jgi:hypothetical protein
MAPAPKRTDAGLKKISAERTTTFLLDAISQMPHPQKRVVPPPPPYPRGPILTQFFLPGDLGCARSRPFKHPHSPCALRSRFLPWT